METIKERMKWDKNFGSRKVLYMLTDEDAQMQAGLRIGRKLTDDELHRVHKCLEFGLQGYDTITIGIEEAVAESERETQSEGVPSQAEAEICNECGRSVKLGSGQFANRVPDGNDFQTKVASNKPYPRGEYLCWECDDKCPVS